MRWYQRFERGWETAKNYFRYRVSSALSEGINNVIKSLKRRAFGYKNMEYFQLKIMQVWLLELQICFSIPSTTYTNVRETRFSESILATRPNFRQKKSAQKTHIAPPDSHNPLSSKAFLNVAILTHFGTGLALS